METKHQIRLAPNAILVDGVLVARSLQQFKHWIHYNNHSPADFENWPFSWTPPTEESQSATEKLFTTEETDILIKAIQTYSQNCPKFELTNLKTIIEKLWTIIT